MNNITSITSAGTGVPTRQQGAKIHSVSHEMDRRVHYGVQSATFVRTVFPNQSSGTYRVNSMLPTWHGTKVYMSKTPSISSMPTSSPPVPYKAAGSPPIPYPPYNASAYYSNPHTRIIPNR